jgi:hypothetical protein
MALPAGAYRPPFPPQARDVRVKNPTRVWSHSLWLDPSQHHNPTTPGFAGRFYIQGSFRWIMFDAIRNKF